MKKFIHKFKNFTYHFIKAKGLSAVTALLVIIIYISITQNTEKLFDLSFFTSLFFALVLEGFAHHLGTVLMNRLEDSAKLTTDYGQLMKQYPRANWYRYKETAFPIIFEGWLQNAKININDSQELYK